MAALFRKKGLAKGLAKEHNLETLARDLKHEMLKLGELGWLDQTAKDDKGLSSDEYRTAHQHMMQQIQHIKDWVADQKVKEALYVLCGGGDNEKFQFYSKYKVELQCAVVAGKTYSTWRVFDVKQSNQWREVVLPRIKSVIETAKLGRDEKKLAFIDVIKEIEEIRAQQEASTKSKGAYAEYQNDLLWDHANAYEYDDVDDLQHVSYSYAPHEAFRFGAYDIGARGMAPPLQPLYYENTVDSGSLVLAAMFAVIACVLCLVIALICACGLGAFAVFVSRKHTKKQRAFQEVDSSV